MTTSTLARLNELAPKSRFDERRFRMNVIVKTDQPGFVENGWVGLELALGGGVRLNVALLDPRCVMTTLAQEDLPRTRRSSGRWCATTAWNCRAWARFPALAPMRS